MGQAKYRCVECSQPIAEEGLLCPACQKRTGKVSAATYQTTKPDAGPLYATALTPPPLYTAPPAQPVNLSGDTGDVAQPPTGGLPAYTPPPGQTGPASTPPISTGSVPATGSAAPGPAKVYPPVGTPVTPQRAAPSSDDALQRANVELAMLKLKQSEASSQRANPAMSLLSSLPPRLMIRLVLFGIIAIGAGLRSLQSRHSSPGYPDSSYSRSEAYSGGQQNVRPPAAGYRAPAQYGGAMTGNRGANADPAAAAAAERQTIERLNAAYSDAKQALDRAENGSRADLERLLAQVDSDVQMIRNSASRLSPQAAQQYNQAAMELESRAQTLQNQAQMPAMPQQQSNPGNGVSQDQSTGGAPPPIDSGGQQPQVGGRPGSQYGGPEAPANGANGQAGGTPIENPPPGGNGNQ